MNSTPVVSVIIPVFNGAKYLAGTLQSVFSLGLANCEVIVVDDGSTDESVSVAAGFGESIRIVRQANAGPAAARNHGLRIARGEIIGFLDADDRWAPAVARAALPMMLADDSLGIAQGRVQEFAGDAEPFDLSSAPYEYLNLGSALYRKHVFDRVGTFDESLRFSEDYDWMLRAFDARIDKKRITDVTLWYRIHDRGVTRGRSLHERSLARVHGKAAARRRQSPGLADVPAGFPKLVEYIGAGRSPRLERCDDRTIDPSAGAVRGFMVVRNEARRLPACLSYHRALGVSRFFIVDNASEDGSREWLLEQPDVHVWRTSASFAAARCGTDWTESLLRAHGEGHWCLVIDPDELLVYPDCEVEPLPAFCARLDRAGYRAAMALMIDMYSDRPIRDTHLAAGQPFLEACRYFDRHVYDTVVDSFHEHRQHPSFFGGVRQRLFGGKEAGGDERYFYCLNKVPLIRYDRSIVLSDNLHWTSCREVAVQAAALLHFKFVDDFAERAVREAQRGEHWSGAAQYVHYAAAMQRDAKLTPFDQTVSVRYEGSSQLVERGLLRPIGTTAPEAAEAPDDRRSMLRQVRRLIRARQSNQPNPQVDGMALLKEGRWHEAAALFRKAIADMPDLSWAHHYLGDALAAVQHWPDSIEAYRRALELNPHFAPSHFNLGEVYAHVERWHEAVACYRRAIELQPDLANAARSLARALVHESRALEREALSWYGRAHAVDPDDMAIYREAAGLRPPDADLCVTFAEALAARGHRTKAIFFYQLAIQIRPDDGSTHRQLANVLRQSGDLAGAIASCRRAIVLDEQRAEYHACLAAMLADRGELDEAIAAYQRAIARQPDEPAWLKELGDLLARSGRTDEAASTYALAVSRGYQCY